MFESPLDAQILNSIERARRRAEETLKNSASIAPDNELKHAITEEFVFFNLSHQNRPKDSAYAFVQEVKLDKSNERNQAPKNSSPDKSIVGGALVLAGQPILRKRFVMVGSTPGTSIASKYLSRFFPQRMPVRILGTRVLGRAIGRMVPYVGWALIAVDVVELLIEESRTNDRGGGAFRGFGGGSSGGGGASGSW